MDIFGKAVIKLHDLERVCKLPIIDPLTEEEIDYLSDLLILKSAREGGFRFLPEQANMLAQFLNYGCLFGCAAAGAGKTLTALAVSNLAYQGELSVRKHKKILYLLPSALVEQLKTGVRWASKRINMTVPIHYFSDYKGEDRITLSKTAGNGIYILGYGLLSSAKVEIMIHNVKPTLIIADECHTLTNRKSARTRRVMHYLKAQENTSLVLLSGTIVRKNIMEYSHLIDYALKDLSPVPRPWPQAESLSIAMTEPTDFIPSGQIRSAKPLVDWAGESFSLDMSENTDVIRKSYNKRLKSAPGVFISESDKVATSLYLNPITSKGHGTYGYKELKELVKQVEEEWVTPSGDEFDYVLEKFKWVSELWQGFYNDLQWPEDHPLVEQAKDCHEAGNYLAKLMRDFLGQTHRPHLDTPLLVKNNMRLFADRDVPTDLYQAWKDHKSLNIEGLPSRISTPIRVSDFKVTAALNEWKNIEDGTGGIVWYYNNAYGKWLKEVFEEEYPGRVLFAPAGKKSKEEAVSSSGKIVIASIEAHGTGTDGFQLNYHNNLIAQDFRTSKIAEQTIARTHRHGQKKDEMIFNILLASRYDDMKLSGILQNSYFVHMSHTRQRLLTGAWLTSPKQFDPKKLRQAGMDVYKGFTAKNLEELKDLV